jgi:ParB-like chromosome segregation protein Spo0J
MPAEPGQPGDHHGTGLSDCVAATVPVLQSEQVDPANVTMLRESIVRAGRWLEPIIVERSRGIVMDGNHRFNAALQLA